MLRIFGFRGPLPDATAERTVRRYRERLLAFTVPDRRQDTGLGRITPSAYQHTFGGGATVQLANQRLWGWLAGGSILALLIGSVNDPDQRCVSIYLRFTVVDRTTSEPLALPIWLPERTPQAPDVATRTP